MLSSVHDRMIGPTIRRPPKSGIPRLVGHSSVLPESLLRILPHVSDTVRIIEKLAQLFRLLPNCSRSDSTAIPGTHVGPTSRATINAVLIHELEVSEAAKVEHAVLCFANHSVRSYADEILQQKQALEYDSPVSPCLTEALPKEGHDFSVALAEQRSNA